MVPMDCLGDQHTWANKSFYDRQFGCDGSVKLGGYATFALWLLPPFNPLPCRYSLKSLESHSTTLVVTFFLCCSSITIFHHSPLSFPLWKRVYIVCQLTKDVGKSRQGTPVLNRLLCIQRKCRSRNIPFQGLVAQYTHQRNGPKRSPS